ncbi:MAG TPA: hypothetical protein VJ577_04735 [Burkholderiaceae bacterium]|nr:hypothetical protein [Burkholderiaceae bacterium]
MDIHELQMEDFIEAKRQQEIRRRNAMFKQQTGQSKGFFREDNTMLIIATLVACLSWFFVGMQVFKSI